MLRYDRQTKSGLVALYDIRPGNGAGPFLQPRSPHGARLYRIAFGSTATGFPFKNQIGEMNVQTSEWELMETMFWAEHRRASTQSKNDAGRGAEHEWYLVVVRLGCWNVKIPDMSNYGQSEQSTKSPMFDRTVVEYRGISSFPVSSLTLLVGWQEGHPECTKLGVGLLGTG